MTRSTGKTELSPGEIRTGRWMVKIFNNDYTPYRAVVFILMAATGCDLEEAEIETWEADHYGEASVHFDAEPRCREIAAMISKIGVNTAVCPEWED
jgi:ATP-dependent Clp protease adaptor protein ClpS